MEDIINKFSPNRIIVEPTGVAKLSEILRACNDFKFKGLFEVNNIISVLDVKRFDFVSSYSKVFVDDQIAVSKTIVLSKNIGASIKHIEDIYSYIKNININKVLEDLEMKNANINIHVDYNEDEFFENGKDVVEFYITTNLGEDEKQLSKIASGGEMSRIMLAIKKVLADTDKMPVLIFDEIDTGISGRTAQKVSEKMDLIGRNHQVICITHLPQIAAMADTHFLIEKTVESGRTTSKIHRLPQEESVAELARMLGGVSITETVLENAKEMKELAAKTKKS